MAAEKYKRNLSFPQEYRVEDIVKSKDKKSMIL